MVKRSKAASSSSSAVSSNPSIEFEPNNKKTYFMKRKRSRMIYIDPDDDIWDEEINDVRKMRRKLIINPRDPFLSISDYPRYVDDSCFTTITNTKDSRSRRRRKRGIIIQNSIGIDVNFLVFEILSRLPVKTLVRFKSVCKTWKFIIEKDQNFINLHFLNCCSRKQSRLLMVVPVPQIPVTYTTRDSSVITRTSSKELYVTADLIINDNTKIVVEEDGTIRETVLSCYTTISQPVNGLICLTESGRPYSYRIYNICTRQESPWFQSKSMVKNGAIGTSYGFGFDPATNEHKLVCVHHLEYPLPHTNCPSICEVLTIGGRCQGYRWTRIEEEVPFINANGSIYVNGVIYWNTLNNWYAARRPVCIVAFDVGSEKFRTITIPDFILDHHPNLLYAKSCFIEVDGRFAMIIRMNKDLFKMYLYKDDEDTWRELSSFVLPFYLEEFEEAKFYSFVGSDDKIIVINFGRSRWVNPYRPGKKKCVTTPIYCYNWKNDSWTEFDASGTLSSFSQPQGVCSSLTTFSESLFPVCNQSSSATTP